ncbi:MAG TPA: DUF4153 domain-containing protein [Bacteroidia bacterium]|nr:DUF4153 domain-containing protein [Bacteroidia bacterium]
MKKNDWILLLSVSLYSFLFYQQNAGINFAIFSIALIIALLGKDKTVLKNKYWCFAAIGTLISALLVGYYGNTLCVITNIISLSYLSAMSVKPNSSLLMGLLFSAYSYSSSLIFMFVSYIDKRINTDTETEQKKGVSKKVVLIIIPLLVTSVFFFMYRASNALFDDLASKINFDFISLPWVAFTIGGFILLYGFFYHRKISVLADIDENASNYVDPNSTNTISLFGKKWSLEDEEFSGRVMLILLNSLLLLVNGLDINFLFIDGKLPRYVTYSGFVHQGIGMLITSILIAIAIILFYFRGALNFYKKNKALKLLAYIWIIQNAFMLISTGLRNEMYINEYGLTYKRIGVYIYLLLTLVGLLTTIVKIYKNKSNHFLFRINGILFYSLLVVSCFFSWDDIITSFNISRARLEKNYLLQLSETNLPQLYKLKQSSDKEFKLKTQDPALDYLTTNNDQGFSFDEALDRKLFLFLTNCENHNWKSWYFDEQKTYEQLQSQHIFENTTELNLRGLYLTTLPALSKFTNLKKLNLYNNAIASLNGIEKLDRLEYLDISQNQISDYTPLYCLKNLRELIVNNIDTDKLKELQSKLPNTKINN